MQRLALILLSVGSLLYAARINFGSDTPGTAPKGWSVFMTQSVNGAGVRAKGAPPRWEVIADRTAPSKKGYVVGQTSNDGTDGRFPLLIYGNSSLKDGEVSMAFKAISGRVDQGAGVVWRYQDPDTYYLCRANALEDNVVLYKVEKGSRIPLPPVGQPTNTYGTPHHIPSGVWQTLRVTFKDSLFNVYINGEKIFDVDDKTFTDTGKVGLWTKSDSVMSFDNFDFK